MKLISVLYSTLLLSLCLSCNSGKVHTPMLDEIESYVSAFDARIGIAVITGKDTLSLHGGDQFPMMSVYKFPIAILPSVVLEFGPRDITGFRRWDA